MNKELVTFGSRLRQEREARGLSIVEISRVTKIPERSLLRMEAGEFEELPGDVFVRGFLRSYARCVGLDPEEMVRQYGEIATNGIKARKEPSVEVVMREAIPEPGEPEQPVPLEPLPQDPSALSRSLSDADLGPKRISLTLAVIILVIVATLTLSLLLRRPSHVGSGVSMLGCALAGFEE